MKSKTALTMKFQNANVFDRGILQYIMEKRLWETEWDRDTIILQGYVVYSVVAHFTRIWKLYGLLAIDCPELNNTDVTCIKTNSYTDSS